MRGTIRATVTFIVTIIWLAPSFGDETGAGWAEPKVPWTSQPAGALIKDAQSPKQCLDDNLGADVYTGDLVEAGKCFRLRSDGTALRAAHLIPQMRAGSPKSIREAVTSKAMQSCTDGDGFSCTMIGVSKEEFNDTASARSFYKKGCNYGHAEACQFLAEDETDLSKLEFYLTKACDSAMNEKSSCEYLQTLSVRFEKTADKIRVAKSACAGLQITCGVLADIEAKLGNFDEARRNYKLACATGGELACGKLGVMEYDLGNFKEARNTLSLLCKRGKTYACNLLGMVEYRTGNPKAGRKVLNEACNSGDESACKVLEIFALQKRPVALPVSQ